MPALQIIFNDKHEVLQNESNIDSIIVEEVKNYIFSSETPGTLWIDRIEHRVTHSVINDLHFVSLTQNNGFEVLIDNTKEGIYTCSPIGLFIYVNKSMTTKTGYSREELLTMYFTDLIPKEYKEDVFMFYKKQLTDNIKNTTYEFPIETKTGKKEWVNQTVTIIEAKGEVLRLQTIARFVTEKVEMEETLKYNHQETLALLNATNEDIIVVCNPTERLIRISTKKGSPLSELSTDGNLNEAKNLFLKDLPLPETALSTLREKIRKSDRYGQRKNFNINVPSTEGTLFHIVCNAFPYGDKKSIVTFKDITVSNLVQGALTDAKNEAKITQEESQNLIATLGHEVRNPLNVVLGMTNLLLEKNQDPESHKQLNAIKLYSNNALMIVNNLLDQSKINSNKVELENITFDVKKHIEDLLNSVAISKNNKKINTSVEFGPKVPLLIIGDQLRLGQILINLLGNSFKFTESGSISVYVRKLDNLALEYTVSDTGIGIKEESLSSIFEPFTQAESDTSRKFGGTGLGLTIVKNLIELQGGTIHVESEYGKGTSFIFTIQYKEPEKRTRKRNETNNTIKTLLVEDEPLNQSILSNYLSHKKIEYDLCDSIASSINKINTEFYDLILLDYHLGNETADVFINHLRNKNDSTPIILISGFNHNAPQLQGLDIQGNIPKPVPQQRLYDKIEEIIGRPLSKSTSKESGTLYDLSYLIESSLNDSKYIKNMIKMFIKNTPNYLAEIKEAHKQNDLKQLTVIAHKFKASVNILGVKQVAALINHLEESIATNTNIANLSSLISGIELYSLKAIKELEKTLKN